jgi:hypothetical protein
LTCRTERTPLEAKEPITSACLSSVDEPMIELDALASAYRNCSTPPPAHPFRFHNVKQPSIESVTLSN